MSDMNELLDMAAELLERSRSWHDRSATHGRREVPKPYGVPSDEQALLWRIGDLLEASVMVHIAAHGDSSREQLREEILSMASMVDGTSAQNVQDALNDKYTMTDIDAALKDMEDSGTIRKISVASGDRYIRKIKD